MTLLKRIDNQIETANKFMALWRTLIPDLEPPDAQCFLIWTGTYREQEVLRGINRAAFKVRKLRGTANPMTPNDAERYAASVMRNEFLGVTKPLPNMTFAQERIAP
jgi:hypothetical protein